MDKAMQRPSSIHAVNNVHGRPEGNSAAKALRRLRKDRPDLLAYCRNAPEVQQMIRARISPVATHAEAGAKGGAIAGRGRPKEKVSDNVTSLSERGNSATHTLRRLKRDRPDLAEQADIVSLKHGNGNKGSIRTFVFERFAP